MGAQDESVVVTYETFADVVGLNIHWVGDAEEARVMMLPGVPVAVNRLVMVVVVDEGKDMVRLPLEMVRL